MIPKAITARSMPSFRSGTNCAVRGKSRFLPPSHFEAVPARVVSGTGTPAPSSPDPASFRSTIDHMSHININNTLITTSFSSTQGSRLATLSHGLVATQSVDGLHKYMHVLRTPTGNAEKGRERYLNILQLPAPADGKTFLKAVVPTSGCEVKMEQSERGIMLEVPRLDAWDPIDTVIRLTIQNPGTPSSATKASP
jgi:hypothetical protein